MNTNNQFVYNIRLASVKILSKIHMNKMEIISLNKNVCFGIFKDCLKIYIYIIRNITCN